MTKKKKKVIIIGGGPAGLRAAIVASQRGHDVTLIEKENSLGGQLRHVSKEVFKEEVNSFLKYLLVQINKSSTKILLNTEATREMVINMHPDAIIIAIGAEEIIPPIKGVKNSNVLTGTAAIDKADELAGPLVVIGGGTVGAEIALEQSLNRKNEVTIIEMSNELAKQGNMLYKIGLRQKMSEANSLNVLLESSCQEIKANSVIVKTKDGKTKEIPAKNVILCTGLRAKSKIAEQFYGITPEVSMIGDCIKPRKIMEAEFEGYTIAMNL